MILKTNEKLCQLCNKRILKKQKITLVSHLSCEKDGGDFDFVDFINNHVVFHQQCYVDYTYGKQIGDNRVKTVVETLKQMQISIDKNELQKILIDNPNKNSEEIVISIIKTRNKF